MPVEKRPASAPASYKRLTTAQLRKLLKQKETMKKNTYQNTKKKKNKPMSQAGQQLMKPKQEEPMEPLAWGSAHLARPPMTMGSACTGWGTDAQACVGLGVPTVHAFGCDPLPASRKFCTENFQYKQWVQDVFDEEFSRLPSVDLFSAGFPCQPFSTAGLGRGAHDERSSVLSPILTYLIRQRPRCFFLENVKGLLSEKHKALMDKMIKILKSNGYIVEWKVLDSADYGVAQHRERLYIIGIRRDSYVTEFSWPAKLTMPPLRQFWDRRTSLKLTTTRQLNVAAHTIHKIKANESFNPFKTSCIIDVGSGRNNYTYMVGRCPTITKARGMSPGFYDTARNTKISVREMIRLQGSDPDVYNFDCISVSAAGSLAGNAMTVTVVKELLRQLLPAAGLSLAD